MFSLCAHVRNGGAYLHVVERSTWGKGDTFISSGPSFSTNVEMTYAELAALFQEKLSLILCGLVATSK